MHTQVRNSLRNKGHFPRDEAATKLIWLALRHIEQKWKSPPITWHSAESQLAIQFGERFTTAHRHTKFVTVPGLGISVNELDQAGAAVYAHMVRPAGSES